MNPSILAASLLLAAAAPAFAQGTPATPGTAAPHSSGDWGKDEAELRQRANVIMAKLVNAAKAGVEVGGKKVAYAKDPTFVIDLNNLVIGGSPAAAFSAGLGLNSPGRTIGGTDHSANDLIYTTNALYTMADQPEAAVFIAHEIGHLAYGHAKIVEDAKKGIIDRKFSEWEVRNTIPDGEPSSVTVQRFFKDSGKDVEAELAKTMKPLEEQADAYGRELALKAGWSSDAPESAFKRAQDWLWALRLDMNDPNHGTVAQRAAEAAKWSGERKAAAKRAAVASRRAKCAAEQTSCE